MKQPRWILYFRRRTRGPIEVLIWHEPRLPDGLFRGAIMLATIILRGSAR